LNRPQALPGFAEVKAATWMFLPRSWLSLESLQPFALMNRMEVGGASGWTCAVFDLRADL
jgi:hypothetical protein